MKPIVRQIFLTKLPAAIRGCRESSHSCAQYLCCQVQRLGAVGRISDVIEIVRGRGHDNLSNQSAGARFRTRCGSLSKWQISDRQSLSARSRLLRVLGTGLPERTRGTHRPRGVNHFKVLLATFDAQNRNGSRISTHALLQGRARPTVLNTFFQFGSQFLSMSELMPHWNMRACAPRATRLDCRWRRLFFSVQKIRVSKGVPS
jgi:hypothetical protein